MVKIKIKRERIKFASDNVAGACPEVLEAILKANEGDSTPYGNDPISTELQDKFSEIFEKEVIVFPTASGTAANALALSSMTPSYGNIYCHKMSHINTDECGAPEFYTGGGKLVALNGVMGKITAEELDQSIGGKGIVHHTQPSSVSITQVCETGEVYQLDEIKKISDVAHKHNLNMHMDGARFANALVSLDTTPAEMTWKSGIDVLSFGATKNGCLAAEAIIFFKKEGTACKNGEIIATIEAQAEILLSKERVLLNLLQRLSGIATLTNKYIQTLNKASIKILDTRKTTPGIRLFEKYAVNIGGGHNHRLDLEDGVMFKDNHLIITHKLHESIKLFKAD